jgi:sugar-specific transcriptional regulator TrmB
MKQLSNNLLRSLNLSDDQLAVYLATLELGQASIQALSKKSGVKRPTIYHFLPQLLERGLIQETRKHKRNVYTALHPNQLVELEKVRIKELEQLVPELSAIYNKSTTKPRVTFFAGVEGIKEALTDFIRLKQPMIGWADFSFRQSVMKDFFDMFADIRAKHEITYQAITRDTPEAREWAEKNNRHLRDFKYIDCEPFNTETLVYGDHVMFLSYQQHAFAVVIEDTNVAATLRIAWQQLWDRLE